MISFWRIFWLEILSLTRSRTLAMLLAGVAAWMLALPSFVKGDGTETGVREVLVHYSLGGAFVLTLVVLLASATGSIASERTARRLQLTLVRPVRYVAVVLGKALAHVTAGALVLAVAALLLAVNVDLSRPCRHVLSPVLPSPQEEAKEMYDAYMADPGTPESVKRAKKSAVLRILEQRAQDHYQTVPTNSVAEWKFGGLGGLESLGGLGGLESLGKLSVRMRFTNQMDMRQDVVGIFRLGPLVGVVSNMTQAVLEIPLQTSQTSQTFQTLSFENKGKNALMLRPRKDVNLLVRADSFGANLLRTYVGLLAVLAAVLAVGLFLSASLGRPVAMFVAFVMLIVGEMSPSVVAQYPDALESDIGDRIGLYITRFAAEVTRPVSAAAPLEALAKDECVEMEEVLRLVLSNMLAFPLVLALLSAFVLPRKQEA